MAGGVQTLGKAALAGLAGDTGGYTAFKTLAYGTDDTAWDASQQNITTSQIGTATVSQVTTTTLNDTLQLAYVFTIVAGSETIKEIGVFNQNGTMLSRDVLGTPKSVTAGDTYSLTDKTIFA